MLTDQRIRELYETAPLGSDWLDGYQAFVTRIAKLSDDELLSPAGQSELWLARNVTKMRRGEVVAVEQASQDADLAEALVALRNASWPEDPENRAAAIQAEFNRIMGLVHPRYSASRPWAQLTRAFAVLLPTDLHCVVIEGGDQVHRLLLPKWSKENFVADHVLTRAKLRDVLGPEADLDEHVKRSVFCWWLYEEREAIAAAIGGVSLEETKATPRLALWPFPRQRKGLAAPKGMSNLYREALQAAIGGANRAEIVEALGPTRGHKESTRNLVISVVIFLGLLEDREGRLFPSQSGREFLESETPDALVEALLVRVFPFAHLLRKLSLGPKKAPELYEEFQEMYPQWTTNQSASQAAFWAKRLGLIQQTSNGFELTDYGKSWEERLPADLPSPTPAEASPIDTIEEEDEGVFAEDRLTWPDFPTVLESFRTDEAASKLVFEEHQLAAIHAAWHCNPKKRFLILSGLSGTGKTKVVQTYARLFCANLGLDPKKHVALVPVSPDWRDPSGLLGYLSALHEEPTFHIEPALRLLLDASADPGRPYFLLLDEMNLARVERYFAPFLSAMETGDALILHGGSDEIDGVPPRLRWPTNLFIAGTVNMDETTYPFSDKVLDRAFTFEFWEVDLDGFFEKQAERDEVIEGVLRRLHEILQPVRRHFGYRTAEEILAFTKMAAEGQRGLLLDQAIFSKILPRIRGENSDGLQRALAEAKAVCADHKLERSAKKLGEMRKLLEQTGLTKFWA